jgi:hypothetical membrane protein
MPLKGSVRDGKQPVPRAGGMNMKGRLSREIRGKLLILCLMGFVLYGILNILAMIVYSGGTSGDAERTEYSCLDNYFSDLGMVRTYRGEPNTLSCPLFASALVLVGLVLMLFFPLLSTCFPEPLLGQSLSRAGTTAGIVSGISCVGIALTPWDRFLEMHMFSAYCLSLSFLAVALLYSAAILRNPAYPNGYAVVFIVYFVVLLMFVTLMVLGPDPESSTGGRALATGQKVCIYSGMVCIGLQVVGAYLFNRDYAGDGVV